MGDFVKPLKRHTIRYFVDETRASGEVPADVTLGEQCSFIYGAVLGFLEKGGWTGIDAGMVQHEIVRYLIELNVAPEDRDRNMPLPDWTLSASLSSEDCYDTKTLRKKYPVRLHLTWSQAERLYHAGKRNDERAMVIWARLLGTAVRKIL